MRFPQHCVLSCVLCEFTVESLGDDTAVSIFTAEVSTLWCYILWIQTARKVHGRWRGDRTQPGLTGIMNNVRIQNDPFKVHSTFITKGTWQRKKNKTVQRLCFQGHGGWLWRSKTQHRFEKGPGQGESSLEEVTFLSLE